MTKEEIIAAIKECAEKLGEPPSFVEVRRFAPSVTIHTVRKIFGTYSRALAECNLTGVPQGQPVPEELLIQDWVAVVRKLNKIPTLREYGNTGRYSARPLLRHFRTWNRTPRAVQQHITRKGLDAEHEDVLRMISAHYNVTAEPALAETMTAGWAWRAPLPTAGPIYGAPMMPAGMAFAPTNEAGVLFLFGMLAERLGYIVTRMQTGYPDCEALRQLDEERWQRVRIELEYESRNFLSHMHQPKDCDIILCWIHNWPECPLEVVELKSVVKQLAAEAK